MITLIIGAFISVVVFLAIVLKNKEAKKKAVTAANLLAILPLLLSIAASCVAIIPANRVGVVYSPFKGVSESTLSEGWHSKGIFDQVYNINTEIQTKSIENVSGQTQDSQYITMVVDVKYKVDSGKAYEVFRQYRNLENVSNSFIAPAVQRSIEAVSVKYNIMEILGEKRNELYKEIEADLKERLATGGISFVSINFTDTDAGDGIEKAIQDEAIAKKAVETAEQERLKAEVEAQKRVVEAEANKEKAQIEAETKLIQAQAEADANRLIAESLTPEVIQKMEMEARLKHGWVTVKSGDIIVDSKGE